MKFLYARMKPFLVSIIVIVFLVFARAMAELALPRLMSIIVDDAIVDGDIPYIWQLGGFMLLITFGAMLSAFLSSFLSARVAVKIGTQIREEVFTRISSFSLADMDRFGASSLITRVSNDVMQIQNLLLMTLRIVLRAPLLLLGGIFMAVTQDAQLSLVLLLLLPLLTVMIVLLAKKTVPLFALIQEKTDALNRIVRENLTGLRVIRAFNRRNFELARFHDSSRELADTGIHVGKLMSLFMPYVSLLLNLAIVLVLFLGSQRVALGEMAVGSLMAFIQYVGHIMFGLVMVSMLFIRIPQAAVSLARLEAVMETSPAIRETSKPLAAPKGDSLVFESVSMRYHGAESLALENIRFECCRGETFAIIGGTGSGKTSLLNLILRFYDVENGSVSIDKADIRQLRLKDLRSLISYVPQRSFLFSGSIRDNLLYSRPAASDDELWAVLEAAQIQDFVRGLDQGLDSQLSKGGTTVSGGERQRLAIARALLRRSPIYLFDDCFSALDANTEMALKTALQTYTENSMVLMVTQRVSSARYADRILVLDEGHVHGLGSHDVLAKDNAVYIEIMGSQLDKEDEHGA